MRIQEVFEEILKKDGNWRDRLILLTNRHSNDYGHDWFLSVKVLFIVSLYLFVFTKLVLLNFRFENSPSLSHIAQFLMFMINPIHKFGEIFPGHEDSYYRGFAECLDIVGRLFSGYMIFQFLKAFRKYVRS